MNLTSRRLSDISNSSFFGNGDLNLGHEDDKIFGDNLKDPKPEKGLTKFLKDLSIKRVLIPSQFELHFYYTGSSRINLDLFNSAKIDYGSTKIDLMTCYATEINIPSIRHNFTEIFYHGQSIELPQTYEYEHDFLISFINDWHGDIYEKFITLLKTFGGNSTANSGLNLEIKIVGERAMSGMKITLCGIRFKNVSQLNFSYNNGNEISTFSVSLGAICFKVNDEEISFDKNIEFFESFLNIGK